MRKDGNATPAVGYVRMSSGRQEKSPAQQRAEIKRLAEREGYNILRWYSDEGISGDATDRRVGFQQMIGDATDLGDFAAILCWDQDRFGRFDSIEAGKWIYPLRAAGVWLVTCSQGVIDWNDFAGRMIYSIQQEGKHTFLVDLSRNILRGKIESAKRGQGATTVPYGYDRAFYDQTGNFTKRVPYGEKFTKPREWSVRFVESEDTQAVETVRWLFQTFADADAGMTWMAADLNRRGAPSPRGKRWSVQSISRILRNHAYVGTYSFGSKREGKYHFTGDDGDIERGRGQRKAGKPIVVEDVHDRLVDRLLFDRVQTKLESHQGTGRAPRYSSYLLSGVIRCGHCGAPLAGKGYSKGNVPRYYICTTGQSRPGECHRYQIPQAEMDEFVLGVVEQALFDDAVIERIRRSIYRQAKQRVNKQPKTAGLKAKIKALDDKIEKGTENLLLADADNIGEMSRLLSAWREEREKLQHNLEAAGRNPGGLDAERLAEKAIAEIEHLRSLFREGNPATTRTVIRSLIEEIRVFWERYGKRGHRMTYGELTYRSNLDIAPRAKKTA